MAEDRRISPAEAAEMIGCSVACVREKVRRKIWPIGWAEPAGTGKYKWNFYIYENRVKDFVENRETVDDWRRVRR